MKRGDSSSCTYAAPASKRKGTKSGGDSETPEDVQGRINRLENLILMLMGDDKSAAAQAANNMGAAGGGGGPRSGSLGSSLDIDDSQMMESGDGDGEGEGESETDGITKNLGILKVDQERNKTVFIGEAHWAALLNEIGEVKNYFAAHKNEYEAQIEKIAQTRKNMPGGEDSGSAGPALLFGASAPPPRSEILRQMPSRYMADILVGRYFNSYDPATHILHGPSFQRQYQTYWENPDGTSIVWIGMLFAIMRLAMLSYAREGDEPPEFRGKCQDMASTFRTQMANCLITADYTKPHAFIIETLVFHLHAEYSSNRDTEASVWVLMGVIVRLAMRMGYHRDSKFFPDVTAFQGEMRRRVWSFVRTGDLLFSFQIALPPMVRLGDSDTDLPRNIYDDEFDENSVTLPPPRPQSEATPISYMIAKSKLSFGFGRVLEETHGVQRKSYEEVLKIDKILRDMYETVPTHLKVAPMAEQTLVPLAVIQARYGLATIYHKALCVLHRRYVRLAKPNNRYMYSRRTCLESALKLLEFQAAVLKQDSERNRMRGLKNYVSSLVAHDYLLAGTLVCMDLYSTREREKAQQENGGDASTPSTNTSAATPASSSAGSRGSVSSPPDASGVYIPGLPYTRDDVIAAVEQSRDIWMTQRDYSMEAYKASELMSVLLLQVKSPASLGQGAPGGDGTGRNNNDEQTAAMTLGMLQSGGLSSTQAAQAAQMAQAQMPMSGSGGTPMAYDRDTMDAFLASAQMSNTGAFGNNFPDTNDWSNVFGPGNTGPFPQNIFGNMNNNTVNGNLDIDWETWEQLMRPNNAYTDPMASLWSDGGSPNNNSYFPRNTASGSPNQTSNSNPPTRMNTNDSQFSMSGGYYASPNQQHGQNQVSGSMNPPDNTNGGGDTFMGASTPGPGGVGMGGWKWNVMDSKTS